MNDAGLPAFLPKHLVPHLPFPLDDAEAVDTRFYKLMILEEIREQLEGWAYERLQRNRDSERARGNAMILIEWQDGTQGVIFIPPSEHPTDRELLRAYRLGRNRRELFESESGRA